MSNSDKIDRLREKLKKGDLNLSEEEAILIQFCPELWSDFCDALPFRNYNNALEIRTIIEYVLFTSGEKLNKELRNKLSINYISTFMQTGFYSSTLVEEFMTFLGVEDEELANVLSQVILEEMHNPKCQFTNCTLDGITINHLLDAKRYDVMVEAKIDFNQVDQETIERMIRECPVKGTWKELRQYQIDHYIYEFTEDDSFEILIDSYSYINNKDFKTDEDKELLKTIANVARSKIEHATDLSELPEALVRNMFSVDTDEAMFKYRDRMLLKKLVDKNCLQLASASLLYSVEDKSVILEKVNEQINQEKKFPPEVFDSLNISVFENEAYLDYLIKQGEVEYLINRAEKEACHDKFEQCIPKIAGEIENGNSNYKKILNRLDIDISNYPELAKVIIRNGTMDSIYMKYVGHSDDIIDEIVEVAKNRKIRIDTTNSIIAAQKVTEKLLENDCIETLCESTLELYALNRPDLLLPKLDNLVLSTSLVDKLLIILPDYPEVLHKVLSNSLIVDKIMEEINHNEELVDKIYNHETYNLLRNHLIEKYQVSGEHLDKMEAQLGSKVLMYIENENVQEILAMDDEEFDKTMELFPDEEYTMTDVEASYESLIQYSYGKENVEDIGIFASMNHAIEDHNSIDLNNLRTKLIIGTKKEFVEQLIEKYDLKNIKNTGELIDYIILMSKTPEKKKYIDILHELTDEYIANSRIAYRNNHYFDELHPEYANVTGKILELIASGDEVTLKQILFDIAGSLDKPFYAEFGKNRFLPDELKDPTVLVNYVISKVRDPQTRDEFLPVLKTIVDYYHDKNRDKCSKEISIGEELKLEYTLEEKSKKNAIVKYIILHNDTYVDKDGNFIGDLIEKELLEQGFSEDLIADCFAFYRGSKECTNDLALVQEKMNIFAKVANNVVRSQQIYEFGRIPIDEDLIAKKMDEDHAIKRIYHGSKSNQNSYRILANLNVELLRNNVLNNKEVYDKIVDIMHKKKLHLIPDQLKPMMEKGGISDDMSNIAGFINFFPTIIENERKKLAAAGKNPDDALAGLASILVNADTYSSVSSVYSQILGDKDAKLIKANAGPNEARVKIKNNERLNEAIEYTAKNFRRTEVTIPTFDEVIDIESKNGPKRLEAVVGNFTDGSNLTHGERTGACMRIGGVGETLFRFVLTNKNGFHIRFVNPETGEYISRVSGFRNGNTVFLNELRCSCNPSEYSDSDVVEACTEVAERLLEKSKDSTCPIENVVITKDYAMKSAGREEIYLGISDNKEGLPKFYSDIGNSGIVLATNATDAPYVPIDMDKSKVPSYEPCRAKVTMSSDPNELFGKINRVASVKTMLSGVPIDEIDSMEFPDGILCGMYSDDWYIYVDDKKDIHYDYIDIDKRAKKELDKHLELVDDLVNKTEKENEMKEGTSYGTK